MYTDRYIQPRKLSEYEKYIPANYHEQILNGELSAIATYDGDNDDAGLVAIMVSATHQGWFEIVWVHLSREYRSEVTAADYLRYSLRQVRRTHMFTGAFCEVQAEEERALHRDVMTLAGMELVYEKNNIYEIRMSQIRHKNTLLRAAETTKCIPLGSADKLVLEYIEEQIAADPRPIPFPTDVDWDSYDADISRICVIDDEPAGLLLFSHAEEYLVLELAYSTSERSLPAMIGSAIKYAELKYQPDQKILIPIVGTGVADILNRMVPDVVRGNTLQAVIWFDDPAERPDAQEILNQMIV